MRFHVGVAIVAFLVAMLAAISFLGSARRQQFTDWNRLNQAGVDALCLNQAGAGDSDDRCNVNGGNKDFKGDINVGAKMFFKDKTFGATPSGANNTDPYYLEKVIAGDNNSSLRLTINDDADESLQIWGNSCATGDCGGKGMKSHHFRADGSAAHRGAVVAGNPDTAQDTWGFNFGLQTYNPVVKQWSHFPWVDGRNYVRGPLTVDGADATINGKLVVNRGDGDWNWLRVSGNHGDNAYLGSDGGNRGIWADGPRDFTIYNQGRAGLTVKQDGSSGASSSSSASGGINANAAGDINVGAKMFFKDKTFSTTPNDANGSDPYYLEKVIAGNNGSSLRLTINDDADESLQIWGNSCAAGDCSGKGTKSHHFRADGSAAHRGAVVAGNPDTAQDTWGFNFGLQTYNPVVKQWSHFPWVDGRNYVRGPLTVDGSDATINGAVNVNGYLTAKQGIAVRDDIVYNGGNNWILHTPDDGRRTLYIAPSRAYGNTDWNWGAQTRFEPDGTVHFANAQVSSDARFKEDVSEIADADLAGLDRLAPSTYKLRADASGRKHFGFVAQAVEGVYPNLVSDDDKGFKSLNYNEVIPLLVGNVQKINKKVRGDKLCIDDVCLTKADLKLLSGMAAAAARKDTK